MDKEKEMKDRTKKFALEVIKYSESLRGDRALDVLARQLLRSGTSIFLNYRAVCRAKSIADFLNKLSIVEEEADEAAGCLELLRDSGLSIGEKNEKLMDEANQITAIIVASIKTARKSK